MSEGVAQGSPLSPLFGNVLLWEFDREMNGRGITCLRYIDDIILFGPTPSKVRRAFESAQRKLSAWGMRSYDPRTEAHKAEEGHVDDGFVYLGCQVSSGRLVQPSEAARRKLLASVRESLMEGRRGVRAAADATDMTLPKQRYAQTITDVDNILKGWGHAFAFCTSRMVFSELDRKVDALLAEFHAFVRRHGAGMPPAIRRRILGVHLLAETPQVSFRS